jgi:hypothetical protein
VNDESGLHVCFSFGDAKKNSCVCCEGHCNTKQGAWGVACFVLTLIHS